MDNVNLLTSFPIHFLLSRHEFTETCPAQSHCDQIVSCVASYEDAHFGAVATDCTGVTSHRMSSGTASLGRGERGTKMKRKSVPLCLVCCPANKDRLLVVSDTDSAMQCVKGISIRVFLHLAQNWQGAAAQKRAGGQHKVLMCSKYSLFFSFFFGLPPL